MFLIIIIFIIQILPYTCTIFTNKSVYIGDDGPTGKVKYKAVFRDNHGAGDDVKAGAAGDQEEGRSRAAL